MTQVPTSTFVYSAMTPAGKRSLGLRAAKDETQLARELKRHDLLLVRSWRMPGFLAGLASDRSSARLPLKDEAAVNEQLHVLLSRGVPLVEALEVASTVVSSRSRDRIERMRELVAGGTSFAEACREVGGFDDVAIAVYRAAERTGDLAGAGDRLAQAARRRLAVRGRAVTVMIYPAIVSIVSIGLLFVMLTFLVPQIAQSVADMGVEPPWFSKVVFTLGTSMKTNANAMLLIAAGLLAIAIAFGRLVIAGVVAVARRIPAINDLMLASELTRFFSVLGAMTKTGVPLAEAMSTATGVIGAPKLRGQLEDLRRSLVEGGVLRRLIERVDALPLATRRLLIAAERSGDLDQAFDGLAEDMADQVKTKSDRLLALMEPAVILLMLGVLGPLILAIALPMIQLSTSGV